MFDPHNRFREVKPEHGRTVLQRRIDATDGEIDRLVRERYGLTGEDIAIVEGSRGDQKKRITAEGGAR
jgi:hypothetical protein